MAKINVKKPFILNLPTGHVHFVPGVVGIEDELAEHWYVKAHSEPEAEQVPVADVKGLSREDEIARAMAEFDQYDPAPPGAEVKKTGRKKKDQ